ncbi:MAG TPA: DUF3644 domain-containing protein [Candidatus Binataceae bacterium]|nr:DUF3644 domain-containing protein [Candidatus Binataceae bacterium]
MLERGGYNDQDILAYFTRPTRSINHRVISEIRTGARYGTARAASAEELDEFLATWPEVDPQTGLSLRGDELLIKAREAMIAAVHTFNSAGLHFRAELFIVTSIISWTYLLHAYYRREGMDYRYHRTVNGIREVETTTGGAEKFWELGKFLRDTHCPLDKGTRQNLEFLLELRHEIEHRSTTRIDDAISAKLQACCINFNVTIKSLFGPQFGLERRLPLALQFVTFSPDQRAVLKKASTLPRNIETVMDAFHARLSLEEQGDPHFAYRVAFVQKTANRASSADLAVEFIKPESAEAAEINRVLLKEVEKPKFRPTQIVKVMKDEGYDGFTIRWHSELWKSLNAQDSAKSYGVRLSDGQWYWYETWLNRVREHCLENAAKYRSVAAA